MNETYAGALNYILRKTAQKAKGKVSGLSTSGFPTPLAADGKPLIADEQVRSANIKARVDEYLAKRYALDEHELSELYKKLEEEHYIYEDKKSQLIKITFKGLDLLGQGGFVKKSVQEKDRALYINVLMVFFVLGATALIVMATVQLLNYLHTQP